MSPRESDRELQIQRLKGALVFWFVFVSTLLILYVLGSGVIYIFKELLDLLGA